MKSRIRQMAGYGAAAAMLAASVSCGDVARTGRAPAMLVVDALVAASGATPGLAGVPLSSDVSTVDKTTGASTVFNDLGTITMHTWLKDQTIVTGPAPINAITLNRYHVEYIRTDGRNTPGVDVPVPFDGAVTATVHAQTVDVPFEIVRNAAKLEAPLKSLAGLGGRVIISTICQVTFYGKDLAGNDVQAVATITINFGDFPDPQ